MGDFYCFSCLYSFGTKKLEFHKNVCENKTCGVVTPSENTKVLEPGQYQKSDETPYLCRF